jgi:hypothetical protein
MHIDILNTEGLFSKIQSFFLLKNYFVKYSGV